MNILALDPGPEKTAWVLYGPQSRTSEMCAPLKWGYEANENVTRLRFYEGYKSPRVAIEEVVSYGLGFDKHLRNTIAWAGVFAYLWGGADAVNGSTDSVTWVTRAQVKRFFGIAPQMNADASIRKALIDEFGGRRAIQGPQKCEACKGRGKAGLGKKRTDCPRCEGSGRGAPAGLLYGLSGDCWSALAVAITAASTSAPE